MKRARLAERQAFADQVARRDTLRGTAPLKTRRYQSRRKRLRMTKAREFRVLGELLARQAPASNYARIGHLLERSVRLMETAEMEYVDAGIDVQNTSSGWVYVSQETTRAIIADCWMKVEEHLVEANVAFNATADEPHQRALTLLEGLQQAARYADVIYTLTPIPEDEEA